MQQQNEVFCTGRGCKVANKCKRFVNSKGDGQIINPPTRVNCLTKQPQPIEGCYLFLPINDNFSKVMESDIGDV